MIAFANAARPKSASCQRPSSRRMRKQPPTIALKRVNTFALTMFQTLRLESAVNAFVRPAAMRSATWACVSPTAGSTCAGSASTSLTASMDHTL
jgi:hypothetical protein